MSSSCHSIRPRRPSLEFEGEILSTRGQRLASLIRRRSISTQSPEPWDDSTRYDELPPWERAKKLIGDVKSVYNWYVTWQWSISMTSFADSAWGESISNANPCL